MIEWTATTARWMGQADAGSDCSGPIKLDTFWSSLSEELLRGQR